MDFPGCGEGPGGDNRISVRSDFDWSTTDPSVAVVEGIAAVDNSDPVALSQEGINLGEHIDPDALDTLLDGGDAGLDAVYFTVGEYTVQITDSELLVEWG